MASETTTILPGDTRTTTVPLDDNDRLVVRPGGSLVAATAFTWSGGGDAVVDNSGQITGTTRVFNTTAGATGSLVFNNLAGGIVSGNFNPQQAAAAQAELTINNSGLMEAGGRVINLGNFASAGAGVTINNLAGGVIRQTATDEDVIRPGQNAVINNAGLITTAPTFAGGGDLIDFQGGGGVVNNLSTGVMVGAKHVVTGDGGFRVTNDGTMIARNGSAVNIDNVVENDDGSVSLGEMAYITNRGTMEGRSAALAESDGDAIDVDGIAQILNDGRIEGLGARGYNDGEPNVSEAIAIGGGTVSNDGVIRGYGRAIQVDNSGNAGAFGQTEITNRGLIEGLGNGPEGVDPADAARFDLRGSEAINLVGDLEDRVTNVSTGQIIGGVSTGGARDILDNSGSITATGGSAVNMGAGNDQVNLYVGSTVTGAILLGDGDDVASSTSFNTAHEVDGGAGNDSIFMYSAFGSANDTLRGGAGDDFVFGGVGDDSIDGGLDNDFVRGEQGNDSIDGGAGNDTLGGDDGNDTIIGGLGNDTVTGGLGDDVFAATLADGADSYDGGDGRDTIEFTAVRTAVNLTLADGGPTTFGTDTITSVENIVGGSGSDRLFGNGVDNLLIGNAGFDNLRGNGGNDSLYGGEGTDILDGGSGNDLLFGGAASDTMRGGSGDDTLDGGEGDDVLSVVWSSSDGRDFYDGGAGSDTFEVALTESVSITLNDNGPTFFGTDTIVNVENLAGGSGADRLFGNSLANVLTGNAGNDELGGGAGNDTLIGGEGADSYVFQSASHGIDSVVGFTTTGDAADRILLEDAMFQNFGGDDAFDLIGSGYLRVLAQGGSTAIQIDVDGGGNSFQSIAVVDAVLTNGMLADHTFLI